jgi:hypothetical protein
VSCWPEPKLDATQWPVRVSQRTSPAQPSKAGLVVDRLELRRGSCELRTPPLGRDSAWFVHQVTIYASDIRLGSARSTGASLLTGRLDTLAAQFGPRAAPAQVFTLNARADVRADALKNLFVRIDGDSSHGTIEGEMGLAGRDSTPSGAGLRLAFAPLAARDLRRFVPSLPQAQDVRLDLLLGRDGQALIVRAHADAGAHGRFDLEARGLRSSSGPMALRAGAATTAIDLGMWMGARRGSW